jgi:mannose-6-phosphate isomerase
MYPLKFEPIYKEMVWGGNKLKTLLNREVPFDKVGESWNISCRKNEMSVISNGVHKGKFISDVVYGEDNYLGTELRSQKEFPLLIKIIDADDNLSIQVHPKDDYAQKEENYPFGKTEMWYIMDAPKDSFLILGVKDNLSQKMFSNAIENGTVEQCLSKLYVQKGDVVNIPAGLLHAITKGVVLAEIQQNSDITYRVFDYNRLGLDGKPRELHVEKALEVIDFNDQIKKECVKGATIKDDNNFITYYIANKYFAIIKYDIHDSIKETSDSERFFTFTCVEGKCRVVGNEFNESLVAGESIFIPAELGEYSILGKAVVLKSFVPNVQKDFIKPLLQKGFNMEQIKLLTDIEIE